MHYKALHIIYPPLNTLRVVQVIDSTDRSRMAIAKSELGSLLQHEHLASVPVLVLANKQDLPDAMNVAQLTEALSLRNITVDWHVQVRVQPCTGIFPFLTCIHIQNDEYSARSRLRVL